jgi:hypothetical protein
MTPTENKMSTSGCSREEFISFPFKQNLNFSNECTISRRIQTSMKWNNWPTKGGNKSYGSLHITVSITLSILCELKWNRSNKKEQNIQVSNMERLVNKRLNKVTQAEWAFLCTSHYKTGERRFCKTVGMWWNFRAHCHQLIRQWDRRWGNRWLWRQQYWWRWKCWRAITCSFQLKLHIIIMVCCHFLTLHIHILLIYSYGKV